MREHYHHGNLKEELIETSIHVISEKGFEALSLRNVSAVCGVSHNAVYRHFESKEQLIEACRRYVTDRLTEALTSVLSSSGPSAEDTLRRLGIAYVSFYRLHPTYYSSLYRNSCEKLFFSFEEPSGNYPPLALMLDAYLKYTLGKHWSGEEALTHFSQFWSLLHGLTALAISPNVVWKGSLEKCLEKLPE